LEASPKKETENIQTLEAPAVPPPPEPTQTTPTSQPTHTKHNRKHALPAALIAVLLVTSLVSAAALYSVYTLTVEVTSLQSQIDSLVSAVQDGTTITTVSDTETVSLSELYAQVENSVVTIECTITQYYSMPWGRQTATTSTAQGSGFITEYEGQMVIITNNHVIEDATTITVTFADGNTYTATVLGTDASNDLAVLSTDAPTTEYHPLEIVSSETVSVGDSVVAIGSPYGLAGTMTTGIVSALDRTITITEDTGSSYDITGLIQTSAPINTGNSGGPLMTYEGKVIGITTAIVSDSDGLGFAISSDNILSVLETLLA
jgi:putative serine protease PepD